MLIWSAWVGALVGAMLKMASPHRNPLSWIFAGAVGSLGGTVGVYVARYSGMTPARPVAFYLAVALSACGVVLAYAAISRRLHRATGAATGCEATRGTRPTIVF